MRIRFSQTPASALRAGVLLSLLLVAAPAWAQRVVVLQFEGDSGKLREQVEQAVLDAAVIEVVSFSSYQAAVAKKKIAEDQAMTPAAVIKVGKKLQLDAAVGGTVDGAQFHVVIFDRKGEELWSKDLKVKKGLLSDEHAQKLSRAIAAAAKQGAERNQAAAPPPDDGGDSGGGDPLATAPPPPPRRDEPTLDATMPEVDISSPAAVSDDRDQDLEREAARRKAKKSRPAALRASIGPTATWRSQCLRPGVVSCKQYETAQMKPGGRTIDFSSGAPYWGVAIFAEFFPGALFSENVFLQGFGVLAGFHFGASETQILEETSQGAGPPKTVKSTDLGWSAQLTWRFQWQMGAVADKSDSQAWAYAGIRGGFQGRMFEIDPTALVPLPSSQRAGFPVLGGDISIPIIKFFRLDFGGSWFAAPKLAPEQIVGYGNQADVTGGLISTGFGLEGGVSGQIAGPVGYVVRVRYMAFLDKFFGQGQLWSICDENQCGGVGEESFVGVNAALMIAF